MQFISKLVQHKLASRYSRHNAKDKVHFKNCVSAHQHLFMFVVLLYFVYRPTPLYFNFRIVTNGAFVIILSFSYST